MWLCLSCCENRQVPVNNHQPFIVKESIRINSEASHSDNVITTIENTTENDSLNLAVMLQKALVKAKRHLSDSVYIIQYDVNFGNWNPARISIEISHLFSPNYRHLIIRRELPWGKMQDIYLLQDENLKHVFQNETAPMSFIRDSIMDINGDSLRDFFVHWYPATGCCERNVYDVYIFRERNGTFCPKLEFMNPVFLPKQKLIHGFEYGHEPGCYTYHWRGLHVDTIQYVYPNPDDPDHKTWIRTNRSLLGPGKVKKQIIKKFPDFYRKMIF